MKVLHINVSDKKGGAAIAAYRLNSALRNIGVDSRMLVADKISLDNSVLAPISKVEKGQVRIASFLDGVPLRFSSSDDTFRSSLSCIASPFFAKKINEINPDIINLHWICDGVLRPEFLPKIKVPIVWTMHDAWPFCGAENYVFKSERYRKGYTKNNRFDGSKGLDFDRWLFARKQKAYANCKNLIFVSPSRWLQQEATKSVLLKEHSVECIPNGLNANLFRPLGKELARHVLGLPKDKKILLFGAAGGTADRRKGFDLLKQALNHASNTVGRENLFLLVYGGDISNDESIPFECQSLGKLNDETSLVLAFSAADAFVIPSLVDNLPNTVLESLACGTPVIGFDVGGMPDMIKHKKNGYLACPYKVEELCEGIHYVLDSTNRSADMNACAREFVLENFTLDHQAKAYNDLYLSLLG